MFEIAPKAPKTFIVSEVDPVGTLMKLVKKFDPGVSELTWKVQVGATPPAFQAVTF